MITITSNTTNGVLGINAALFKWWCNLRRYEIDNESFRNELSKYFDMTANELITSIDDTVVGYAVCSVNNYIIEFLNDIRADPTAKFMFDNWGLENKIGDWIAEYVGTHVKSLPSWKERLKDIRIAQQKMKTVKKILQS